MSTTRDAQKCCDDPEQTASIVLRRTSRDLEQASHVHFLSGSATALAADLLAFITVGPKAISTTTRTG
jgi:hypothetical protein